MGRATEYGAFVNAKNNNSERSAAIVDPAWRVARDAIRELENMWARFGLTPSDRARFDIRDEDPYERYRRKAEERKLQRLLTGYVGTEESEE
jgi:phage terminase small subunit